MGGLNAAQLSGISSDQISKLTDTQLGGLKTAQMIDLGDEQLSGLTPWQLNQLGDKISGMTPAQLSKLRAVDGPKGNPKAQIPGLTPEQLSLLAPDSFTASQISVMRVDQLRGIPPGQIQYLRADQIAQINPQKLGSLTGSQLNAFTPTQLGAMDANQRRAVENAKQKLSGKQPAGTFESTKLTPDVLEFESTKLTPDVLDVSAFPEGERVKAREVQVEQWREDRRAEREAFKERIKTDNAIRLEHARHSNKMAELSVQVNIEKIKAQALTDVEASRAATERGKTRARLKVSRDQKIAIIASAAFSALGGGAKSQMARPLHDLLSA
jgi:hypothetical protein